VASDRAYPMKTPEPLSAGRKADQYASRDEFLCTAAAFEMARLRSLPFSQVNEASYFSQTRFEVPLGPAGTGAPSIRFVRVDPSSYVDGLSEPLRDEVLAIKNRSGDVMRWREMLEVHRLNRVEIPYPFFVSETIVTNRMFGAFTAETQYRTAVERYATGWLVDATAHWYQGISNDHRHLEWPMGEPDHPVVQVSWFDAMSFSWWLSRRAGVHFRVPTKEEWTLAARPEALKGEPCVFPWGNDFAALDRRMNFGTAELADFAWIHEQYQDGYALTSPVTAFPASERGLYDVVGNVWCWNWTGEDTYERRPVADRVATPTRLADLGAGRNGRLTMQGGCYLARVTHTTLFSRMSHPALDGAVDIGFRLVAVRRADAGL
jgi:formylglycine-generating enzyme required for sulfatase activity